MNDIDMKSRVVKALAALCGLFLLVSAIGVGWMSVAGNRRSDQNTLGGFEDLYDMAVEREQVTLNLVGRLILDAGVLPPDWREQDVSSVRDSLAPLIERIGTTGGIMHLALYTPDRRPFLHVNTFEPDDAPVNRASVVKASRTGDPQIGIELDGTGKLAVHAVIPLITDGELTGILEIGKDLADVVAAAAESAGIEYALRLDKTFISRERWESTLDVSADRTVWERLPHSLVLSSSLEEIPYEALRRQGPDDGSSARDVRYVDSGSVKYASALIPITDVGARHIGDVVTFFDTSMRTSPGQNAAVIVFAIILVATAVGFVLVSLLVDRISADVASEHGLLTELRRDSETDMTEQIDAVRKLNFKLEKQRDALNRTTEVLRHKLDAAEGALDKATSRVDQIETVLGATRTRLAIIDGNYMIRYVDPATRTLYGSPANRRCHEYFMQSAAPCDDCGVAATLEPGQVVFAQQTLPREQRLPVQVATAALATSDGSPLFAELRVDMTARNMVERELIEKEESLRATLERSQEMLEAILNATADGILAVNTAGEITHSSSSFSKMWDTPRELVDKRDSENILEHILDQLEEPEEFQAQLRDLFRTLCQTPEQDVDTISFKDGRVFERSSTPIMDKDAVAGRVWSFRDITARTNAEQERMQKERLQGVLELAGAACHELNQPLQALSGYAELLRMKLDEDNPLYEYVETISEQVAKMADTTRKLQSIARYETQEYIEGTQIIDIDKASGPSAGPG